MSERGGGQDPLVRLYRETSARLFSFVAGSLGRRDVAEDILQETFLRAAERGVARWEDAKARSWLFTVANNLVVDHLRARKRLKDRLAERDLLAASAAGCALEPREVLEQREWCEQLERLVAGLPERHRRVVLLRVYSGLTFAQIARVMNAPRNTVLSWMHRALGSLRKALGETPGKAGRQ